MRNYNKQNTRQRAETFIESAHLIHGNKYDYSKVVYVNTHTPVTIVCPTHGDYFKSPVKHTTAGEGCPHCSKIERLQRVTRFCTLADVEEAAQIVHSYQYQYVRLLTTNEYITTNDKIEINCPIHGIFSQTINKHIYQKTGCPQCFVDRNARVRTKTTEQFIKDSINVHGNKYTYERSTYSGAHKPITVTCPTHGDFVITPANHVLHQQGCNMCSSSSPEQIISQALTEWGIEFVHQYKDERCVSKKGNPLKFDFFIPSAKLLIEYDGIYHFQPIEHGDGAAQDRFASQQYNDEAKNEFAAKYGMQLYRIPYFDSRSVRVALRDALRHYAITPSCRDVRCDT